MENGNPENFKNYDTRRLNKNQLSSISYTLRKILTRLDILEAENAQLRRLLTKPKIDISISNHVPYIFTIEKTTSNVKFRKNTLLK